MKTANTLSRSPQSDRAAAAQSKAGSQGAAVMAPRYGVRLADHGISAGALSGDVAQLQVRHEEELPVQGKFAAAMQPAGEAPVQRLAAAPRKNNTGLPDALKAGVESLSGISMDHVRVHRNSPKPAQLQAHAYAQGNEIHLAPGQERHLPHEAWHVVQQAQGRVKPTLQMKGGVPVNDDAALEREADVMGDRAMLGNLSVLWLRPNSEATPYKTQSNTNGPSSTAGALIQYRYYPGHSSKPNKNAMLEVIMHRSHRLSLSIPEKAVLNTKEFGRRNTTSAMPAGTAICHKVSDSEVGNKIENMIKNGQASLLRAYLIELVEYINPKHLSNDMVPKRGIYARRVCGDYLCAQSLLRKLPRHRVKTKTNVIQKGRPKDIAHVIGAIAVNSPVNLFVGDSKTNSTIQEFADGNQYKPPSLKRTLTPRTKRAGRLSRRKPYKGNLLSSL